MKQSAAMTSFIIGCFETRTQSHTLNGSPETWTDSVRKNKGFLGFGRNDRFNYEYRFPHHRHLQGGLADR